MEAQPLVKHWIDHLDASGGDFSDAGVCYRENRSFSTLIVEFVEIDLIVLVGELIEGGKLLTEIIVIDLKDLNAIYLKAIVPAGDIVDAIIVFGLYDVEWCS